MKILHYTFVLAVVCAISAFGVAGTYKLTRDRINGREREERIDAQKKVVPVPPDETPRFAPLNPDADPAGQVVEARDPSGTVLGYAALGEAQGYGGKIKVMVGMNAGATAIVGLAIVPPLSETPGLGTRVAEVKSNDTWFNKLTGKTPEGPEETVPEFLKQFIGLTPAEATLEGGAGKGIQAITGATISSRGVTNAVRAATAKIQAAAGQASDPPPEAATGATEWAK
jgi:RnfABCDGE-type electron transport complex G subunit